MELLKLLVLVPSMSLLKAEVEDSLIGSGGSGDNSGSLMLVSGSEACDASGVGRRWVEYSIESRCAILMMTWVTRCLRPKASGWQGKASSIGKWLLEAIHLISREDAR